MSAAKKSKTPRIVILGSGISGILMGILLKKRGLTDFVILEKAETLGGTWRDNTYPGLTCDVPSPLYVYSFEPNRRWTSTFPKRADIWEYYDRTARKYGVIPHMRYNRTVSRMQWDGAQWNVDTRDGERFEADIVVTAVSRLHHLNFPDIKGLENFAGDVMHSGRWNHDVQTPGKRVGIIGTGSTSAQILSALVDEVKKITLFQRTPQWVISIPNLKIPLWRKILTWPKFLGRLYYRYLDWAFTGRAASVVSLTPAGRTPRRMMAYSALGMIENFELRKKLTPDYEPSCKRMVISDKFHNAVQKPNVDVVTDRIDHVAEKGIVTKDGKLHELDVLVLATGYKAQEYLSDIEIVGRDGVRLSDYWEDKFVNYRSVSVPNFPNLFMIGGPYGPLGSVPQTTVSEIQAGYVLKLIDRVVQDDSAVEAKEAVARAWTDDVRARGMQSVWGTGCQSYYLDKHGVPTINPQTIPQVRDDLASPDFGDFRITPKAIAQH